MAWKKKDTVYQSWEEVDAALKEVCEIELEITNKEVEMNSRINQLKDEVQGTIFRLRERKKELETNVEEFTNARIEEFKTSKTKFLTFGEVGFRKATGIITRNVKAIIEALKRHRMNDCIIVKETIDKTELAKYDDEALARVGAKRKKGDEFYYKLSLERVER